MHRKYYVAILLRFYEKSIFPIWLPRSRLWGHNFTILCYFFGYLWIYYFKMNRHQVITGAANSGDHCFAVGSVESINFTVSFMTPPPSRQNCQGGICQNCHNSAIAGSVIISSLIFSCLCL